MQRLLRALYRARVPVVIWGPPGVGKTAMIESLARNIGARLLCPHVRVAGDSAIPVIKSDGVSVEPVNEFVEACNATGPTMVFLDEISTLAEAVQAEILRFLDSGLLAGRRIPQAVWRVAAANPPEQAANGHDLSPSTANRLCHIQFKLDAKDWASNFPTYWGNPPGQEFSEDAWRAARVQVAAYIHHRQHKLLVLPGDPARAGMAWPSPRTWDHLSRHQASFAVEGLTSSEEELEAFAGDVGEGEALEYLTWRKKLDLPDPEEILKHPSKLKIPQRSDLAFAILSSVVAAVLANVSKERWEAGWRTLAHASKLGATDIAAAAAVPLARARHYHVPHEFSKAFLPIIKAAGLLE